MPHLTGCPVDYLAPDTACPACGQGTPNLPVSTSWGAPNGTRWTSEPAVAWGDEHPPEEDGTPRQRPIRFTFDGGDTERPCPSCGEDMNQWTPHHTCGGLHFDPVVDRIE